MSGLVNYLSDVIIVGELFTLNSNTSKLLRILICWTCYTSQRTHFKAILSTMRAAVVYILIKWSARTSADNTLDHIQTIASTENFINVDVITIHSFISMLYGSMLRSEVRDPVSDEWKRLKFTIRNVTIQNVIRIIIVKSEKWTLQREFNLNYTLSNRNDYLDLIFFCLKKIYLLL